MKTRLGFVSNSSSSSFCIYGCCLDKSQCINIEVLKNIVRLYPKFVDYLKDSPYRTDTHKIAKLLSNINSLDSAGKEALIEFFKAEPDILFSNCGINYYMADNYDYYYLGDSWKRIGGEETGNQFKARIQKQLMELFGDNIKLDTYSC